MYSIHIHFWQFVYSNQTTIQTIPSTTIFFWPNKKKKSFKKILTICLLKPDNYRVRRYHLRRWYKFFEKKSLCYNVGHILEDLFSIFVSDKTCFEEFLYHIIDGKCTRALTLLFFSPLYYNVGWRQNFESVFGENRWLWLLPVVAGGPVGLFNLCWFFQLISLCREALALSAPLLSQEARKDLLVILLFLYRVAAHVGPHTLTYAHTWHMHTQTNTRRSEMGCTGRGGVCRTTSSLNYGLGLGFRFRV